jgi:hypothetical protein
VTAWNQRNEGGGRNAPGSGDAAKVRNRRMSMGLPSRTGVLWYVMRYSCSGSSGASGTMTTNGWNVLNTYSVVDVSTTMPRVSS